LLLLATADRHVHLHGRHSERVPLRCLQAGRLDANEQQLEELGQALEGLQQQVGGTRGSCNHSIAGSPPGAL